MTIPEIKNQPDTTSINEVVGKIVKVYERKIITGGKSVQNAEIQDGAGNKLRLSVWEHPDLLPLLNQDVTLSNNQPTGRYPGLTVKHGSYVATKGPKSGQQVGTIEISVNKSGVFQLLASRGASNQQEQAVAPQQQVTSGYIKPMNPQRNGMQVGMALNNAAKIIVEGGLIGKYTDIPTQLSKDLAILSTIFLKASDWLEQGHLYGEKKVEAKVEIDVYDRVQAEADRLAALKEADAKRLANVSDKQEDDQIPF